MIDNPVIDSARKAVGLDHESILAEIEGLIRSGMPDAVVTGFMKAKIDDLADRYAEAQWAEAERDELRSEVERLRAALADRHIITDHFFQPVAGHPDDDECTHRSDGSDETYCGQPESDHAWSDR